MVEQPNQQEDESKYWVFSPGCLLVVLPVIYVLSSGPVMAIAFWLREYTGWDGFYVVMIIYYPILMLGHGNPVDVYIDWWVADVFNTVGPG